MRQFTPSQPPADIRVKPQECKPDPAVSLNHDDWYARAWEYDYEQPIFDAENNNAVPPKAQETPVQSDFSTEEMRNTPGTTHECSPEVFAQTDEVSDVTYTYPHMERDVEPSSEQPEKRVRTTPAVPNTIYAITRSLTAMAITDFSLSAERVCSTESPRRRSRKFKERATWHIRSSSKFSALFALAFPLRQTHLLPSPEYFKKTRPLILSSIKSFL